VTSGAFTRYLLGGLLAFGALNAFGGGLYGMLGAEGVPLAWLEGSPFPSYFVPSLILFGGVGGAFLVAAIAVLRRWRAAKLLALGAGTVTLLWLAAQVSIIGLVSWMQPVTAGAAVVILLLAWRLPSLNARAGGVRRLA
jgi:hypothetical protein